MISRRQFLRGDFSPRLPAPPASGKATGPRHVVITPACIAFHQIVCRSCGDACGETAIHFTHHPMGMAFPEVRSDRCTGCGDCVPACPSNAIRLSESSATP